jgi:hypothetical protein
MKYLVYGLQHWAQATVDAKDTAVDDGAKSEIIKDFATPTPHVAAAVLALTLVVKSIHLGDLSRLVVSTDERDAIWISHFERQEEEEGFDAVKAAIHEVSWILIGTTR